MLLISIIAHDKNILMMNISKQINVSILHYISLHYTVIPCMSLFYVNKHIAMHMRS